MVYKEHGITLISEIKDTQREPMDMVGFGFKMLRFNV